MGDREGSRTLFLPQEFLNLPKKHKECVEWTVEQCQKLLVKVVEENLTTCGLAPVGKRQMEKDTASANVKNKYNESLLHCLVKYSHQIQDQQQYMFSLLQHGAELNALDDFGQTPLMYAVIWGNMKFAKSLALNDGTDLAIQDNYGNTVLHLAVLQANEDFANIISRAAVKRSRFIVFSLRNNGGSTAEGLAQRTGNKHLAKVLNARRLLVLKHVSQELRSEKQYTSPGKQFAAAASALRVLRKWRSVTGTLCTSTSLQDISKAQDDDCANTYLALRRTRSKSVLLKQRASSSS